MRTSSSGAPTARRAAATCWRWPTLEVVLVESPRHLHKRYDPETGLALIDPTA